MRPERIVLSYVLLSMLMLCSCTAALSQTDFDTQYLYGTVESEFDSIYMGALENVTLDLDGDTVSDLKLSVRWSGSTHDIVAVNGAYFGVVSSNQPDTDFTHAQISIDIDPVGLDNNTLSYTNAGARTSRLDVYTTDGMYAHVVITMHSINATDNLYSYESYLQTEDYQPYRFSAYLLEEAYTVILSGIKSIDGGAGSDYLYAISSDTIYKIDRETGVIAVTNTDYSGLMHIAFDDMHNKVIIARSNATSNTTGEVIVLNESFGEVARADIYNLSSGGTGISVKGDIVRGTDAGDFNSDGRFDIFYIVGLSSGSMGMVQGFEYDDSGETITSVYYRNTTGIRIYMAYLYGLAIGDTNSDTYNEVIILTESSDTGGDPYHYKLKSHKIDSSFTEISSSTIIQSASLFWDTTSPYRDVLDIDDYDDTSSREEIAWITNTGTFKMLYGASYDGDFEIPHVTGIDSFSRTGIGSGNELALQRPDGTVVFYRYTLGAQDFPERLAGTVNVTYAGLDTRLGGDYALGPTGYSDDVLFLGAGGYAGFNSNVVNSYELCVEDWYTTEWGACVSGVQARTATDRNSCGTTIDMPALSQSCEVSSYGSVTGFNESLIGSGGLQTYELYTTCQPQYECTHWSDCVNYMKTQTCIDINNCPNTVAKVYRRSTCVESDNIYWAEEIHATVLYVDSVLWPPFANLTMIVFTIALIATIFYIFIDLFKLFHEKGGQV